MLQSGARTRSLYLPPGRWVEFWRAVRYDQRTGGLRLVRAGTIEGVPHNITVRAPNRRRTYRLQASMSTLRKPFRPCSARVEGRAVTFRWFRKRRVVHVTFRARDAKLVVSACPSKG